MQDLAYELPRIHIRNCLKSLDRAKTALLLQITKKLMLLFTELPRDLLLRPAEQAIKCCRSGYKLPIP